jgi:hypothetical protein
MLKKVIFAAVLAMGFVTSFKVGASVDTSASGAPVQCTPYDCEGDRCHPILGC